MYTKRGKLRLRRGRAAVIAAAGSAVVFGVYFAWRAANPIRFKSATPRVELGTQYDPLDNIQSVFFGSIDDVQTFGNVNTLLAGEYEIDYIYHSKTYPVTVIVEDTQGPELELKDVRASYEDEVDADSFVVSCKDASRVTYSITNPQVLNKTQGSVMVEITAMDEYGNKTTKLARLTRVEDATPPEVHNDMLPRTFSVGSTFEPLKLDVTDNSKGEIHISCDTSRLDLDKPGDYTVTYTVKDASGNTTEVQETIVVVPKEDAAEDSANQNEEAKETDSD